MNAYQSFLVRKRRYCEHQSDFQLCTEKATTVRQIYGRDTVLCETHAKRIDAVRKSDKQQEQDETKKETRPCTLTNSKKAIT